ncbi:sensor histidine kinase [Corynebacterium propinquum]|uniref:sensor histidine kinase n=1 Tax=Corynebacterium propinquum TaxID=43769 RepID=UPI00191C9C7B|nr:sensor histidine kinase [Corynebacterium propinquum]MDK4251856.1 sensor histidine kinase [Corynebacterium propinquum]QQU86047.1 sensor histidine kinase [Corynebacterium propinquum]
MSLMRDKSLWRQVLVQTPVLVLLSLADVDFDPGLTPRPPAALTATITAVLWVGLLWQRRRPEPALMLLAATLTVLAVATNGFSLLGYAVVCWQAYFIAAYLPVRRKFWVALLLLGAVGTLVLSTVRSYFFLHQILGLDSTLGLQQFFVLYSALIFITLLSIALCWQLGLRSRRRRLRLEELHARAELAAVTERTRIAREMHDIVAHSLTAVIAQADGGRYAARHNPEAALQALTTISHTGRDALTQMRQLLSVLRDDDTRETSSSPGLERIEELLHEARRGGVHIDWYETGTRRQLDPARGLTVYRIVQETLTNIMKHAGPTDARLEVDWSAASSVRVSVDNAPGTGVYEAGDSTGRGLQGMRERARIHGGTARWGDSQYYEGGFNVTVEIPT